MLNDSTREIGAARRNVIALLVVGLATMLALVRWGGVPTANRGLFFAGVGGVVTAVFLFALLTWHLLWRPLPEKSLRLGEERLSFGPRGWVVPLLAISGLCLLVGGFWDEAWHRTYGIPFGEDFFWRPHLLLYYALFVTPLLGALALGNLLRFSDRPWPARFRSDPLLGGLILMGGFTLITLVADPFWHAIYGEDLSALSLPHVLLLTGTSLVMFLAAAMQRAAVSPGRWRLLQLDRTTLLILFFHVIVMHTGIQGLGTDWANNNPMIYRRPLWLLPAIIAVSTCFVGQSVLISTRRVGAATATGVLTVLLRAVLLQAFGLPLLDVATWLVLLPPLLALDLWALARVRQPALAARHWPAGLLATLFLTVLSWPLINRLYPYPSIDGENILLITAVTLVATLGAVSAGNAVGRLLAEAPRTVSPATAEADSRLALLVLAGAVLLIALFIATASPPV